MPTFEELLPATKTSAHNGIRWTPSGIANGGLLEINTGKKSCEYLVVEFPTSWNGRAFRFAKTTPGTDRESESYDVFCSNETLHSCTCRGWEFHRSCKHVEAVRAILENGWLPPQTTQPKRDWSNVEAEFA